MNHKKHCRSFSVFYRNSAILTINIEFVYESKKFFYDYSLYGFACLLHKGKSGTMYWLNYHQHYGRRIGL